MDFRENLFRRWQGYGESAYESAVGLLLCEVLVMVEMWVRRWTTVTTQLVLTFDREDERVVVEPCLHDEPVTARKVMPLTKKEIVVLMTEKGRVEREQDLLKEAKALRTACTDFEGENSHLVAEVERFEESFRRCFDGCVQVCEWEKRELMERVASMNTKFVVVNQEVTHLEDEVRAARSAMVEVEEELKKTKIEMPEFFTQSVFIWKYLCLLNWRSDVLNPNYVSTWMTGEREWQSQLGWRSTFDRMKYIYGRIVNIEYDPNRNAYICLIHYGDGIGVCVLSSFEKRSGQQFSAHGTCLALKLKKWVEKARTWSRY
ncbi:hypothetical protein VNO78_02621 [Psophocarpus tetragonolobus]|uniref:Large ribosomal subunit protein uL2 RNA-binding domain-containing protein n=1 Tax=Psophocarpus tetragonolobus TaxID=3891 RepID=A0AAN9T1L6_PSOTE